MKNIIIDTPRSHNLDPSLRDIIDEAALSARNFRVLCAIARWAGRSGAYRASVETLAKTCSMSESSARNALKALVKGGWLMQHARIGQTTEYKLTAKLHWEAGLAVFVPGPLDDYGLTPLEWRVYYHCVRRADATGQAQLNISHAARACGTNRERINERLQMLTAFGVLNKTAEHTYQLTRKTTWASPDDLPALREQVFQGYTPPCPEATPPLPQGYTSPCPEATPIVNPPLVNPVVEDDDFFAHKENPTKIMHALFDGNLQKVDEFVAKTFGKSVEETYRQWVIKFGAETLRQAHKIISTTERRVEMKPKSALYANNYRLIDFCSGKLDGQEDPHVLCELHTQATRPAPKTFAPRAEGPRTSLGPPPSRFRRLPTLEEAA